MAQVESATTVLVYNDLSEDCSTRTCNFDVMTAAGSVPQFYLRQNKNRNCFSGHALSILNLLKNLSLFFTIGL